MRKVISILLILFSLLSFGQTTDEKKAYDLALKAIELMDNGEFDESIDLLKQSEKLDPSNFIYPFEIGYAYLLKKEYKKSTKMFEKTVKYENATDQCYQMLGNAYDIGGNPEKAIKAYNRGLDNFPNSGRLHLELGNMQQDLGLALQYYEMGIELDPTYPSNYYRATKIFLSNTEEEVWGMIYGELFMNIERGSERTEEISKMLYDIYKSEIKFTSDSTLTVSFSNNSSIQVSMDGEQAEEFKLPFGLLVYEPTILISVIGVDTINLESLNIIRTNFLNMYFEKGFNKSYPNILFEWQKEMKEKGFLESYNYWLLSKGNEGEFGRWIENNEDAFDEFIEWFGANQIKIDENNKFVRKE